MAQDRLSALAVLPHDEQLLAAVILTEESRLDGSDAKELCSLLAGVVLACSNLHVTHHVMNHAARFSTRRHLFFEFLQVLNKGQYISLVDGCKKWASNEHVCVLANGAFAEEINETHPALSRVRKLPEAMMAMASVVSDPVLLRASMKRNLPLGVRDAVVTQLATLISDEELAKLLDEVGSQLRDSTWITAASKAPMRDQLRWAFGSQMAFVYRIGLMRTFQTTVLEQHLATVRPNVAQDIKNVLAERAKQL
jgi:hypothetical protein